MSDTVSTRLGKSGLVTLAGAGLPGRTRFQVSGLYQSPRLGKKLEKKLRALTGIRSVSANTVTGRVLVVYRIHQPVADLVEAIELELGAVPQLERPGKAASRPHMIKKPGRLTNGLGGYLKGLSALFTTRPPAFAATSGFQDAGALPNQSQQIRPWHLMEVGTVVEQLGTSGKGGLNDEEVGTRLRLYGENTLEGTEARSDISIFIGQFNSLPVGLLGVSAVVSAVTGGAADAAVILGVVLINAAIGFVTERQAEKTINSLADTGVKAVRVLRNGVECEVPVEHIVPGDVLVLTPGTYVGADVRLLGGHRLSIDESALTGESLPVSKNHTYLGKQDTPLGDRVNMAYMGTHVTGGSGNGVVIATAKATELGQIQTLVGEAESPDTPMQKQLDQMGTQLALLSGGVCAGVFVVGLFRGFGWMEMLKSSVSLAVAAVPEGLPAVATTTLAMGIKEMRSRNVAVRHLDAVETLGSVQVFCLDKTGTLTINRMTVVAVHANHEALAIQDTQFIRSDGPVMLERRAELLRMMEVLALCSDTELAGSPEMPELVGSATENALVQMGVDAGMDLHALRAQYPRVRTRYRAEGRPFMTTLHSTGDGKALLAVKGSPDAVLALCTHEIRNGQPVELTDEARLSILAENERMAGDALRVLGAAYRELDQERMPRKTEKLTWLGLAGMADPMRTGMDKLMAQYHRAGIETVMITGDQSATAHAIGSQLGLSNGRPLQVLESSALDEMDPQLLAGLAKNVHVFARVSPAHKLKIVRALQEAGYVVAMTGDGINDGPALKASDIGVAMGTGGTDVARSVSDVVLEDDNLHTMEVAVRQGRTIYNNIRKTIHFMVSTNLTEIEVMLAGIALGLGQPMNPMQLLWINLVTDIFPGLALSLEPAEPDIMDRPPRDPNEHIISRSDLKRMMFESGTIGVGTMGAFYYGLRRYGVGAPQASTLAFTTLTVNELAHALSSRSKYRNVFGRNNLAPNPYLTQAVIGMFGAQVAALSIPAVRRLLGAAPLGILDLLVVAGGVVGPLIVNELTKPRLPKHLQEDSKEEPPGVVQMA